MWKQSKAEDLVFFEKKTATIPETFGAFPKMCSRCVRTVSMLSKSFVEIYSHSMDMTRAVYTGLHAAIFATGQHASTNVVFE